MATDLDSTFDRQSVWFVTGCSTGFGRQFAKQLLARGNSVVVTARNPGTLSEFAGVANALVLRLDVTSRADIAAAVHAAELRFGRIDVLVNNAGIGYFAAVEEGEDAEIRRMFDINLFGLAAVTRAVLPGMRKRHHGFIINFSSIGGLRSFPAIGWYNATKFAVEGLSEALWQEVKPLGLQVMLVEPSGFRTDWAGRSAEESKAQIPDYASTAGAGRAGVRAASGRQAGDPVRAVEAVINVVEGPCPPPSPIAGQRRLRWRDCQIRRAASRLFQMGGDQSRSGLPRQKAEQSGLRQTHTVEPLPHARHFAAGIPVTEILENHTFDELVVGATASLAHTVTQRDIDLFAAATGDVNPAHVDPAYAATDIFHHIIIHGMWGGGLISAVLGTKLPGPGTVYLGQHLRFRHPIGIGDTITATVTVKEKCRERGDVMFDCVCTNQHGMAVITGTADTRAPREKLRLRRVPLPDVRVGRHDAMKALQARAAAGPAILTAVVHAVDASALVGALAAMEAGLIVPILIGPVERMRAAAAAAAVDISQLRLLDMPDAPTSAARAVALARAGDIGMIMKGYLHTDQFMHPIVATKSGLRTEKHISHVYVLDVPDYPRLLLLSDMAINFAPSLAEKMSIVQNAIDCARSMGIAQPRVAILAAVEVVNPRMPSTIDAAALCKMADRGQITGGLLDGPLALDNAISPAAAAEKGIVSAVAGRADVLIVPDLEAGNMLAKEFTFLAGAEAAGIVLGASVPIVLTSRADSIATKVASCALGVLMARARPLLPA